MRYSAFGLLIAAAASIPGLSQAVVYPVGTLLAGEVSQSVQSNQCYIVRGASNFQRNAGATTAYIVVAEMVAAGYQLNGDMTLSFSTANSGSASFGHALAYPSNIQSVPFQGYIQTYNATTKALSTQFTLKFPGCTLPVYATYFSQ